MSIRHPMFKVLAIYLALALVTFAPISSLHQAAQAMGLKKLLVGGLVGAAGLLALGALVGPAGAIGAAGCAGTSFLGTLGGGLGTMVSGITGITAAMGTLSLGTMATLGLMVGGAALGIMGLAGTSFVAVPALVLGAGLMAWFWSRSSYRYGTPYDRRYSGPFHDPLFDAGSRIANRGDTGHRIGSGGDSFADRVRSVFDRDRRDDATGFGNRYVDGNGFIRQGTDWFARADIYLNGRNSGYGGGVPQPYWRRERPFSPSTSTGEKASTGPEGTIGDRDASGDDSGEAALAKARKARAEAYRKLIESIRDQQRNQSPSTSAGFTSGFQGEEVQQAIRDYKEADRLVKEITGRLQHREKQ